MSAEPFVLLSLDDPQNAAAPTASERASKAPHVSLRRNSLWMLIGNGVYAVCQWGLLSSLARITTESVVGELVLALSVTAPVMAFFMLQLRGVQATDARHEFQFGTYLALRLVTTVLALATFAGLCLFWGFRNETAWVLLAVAVIACADSLSDVFYGLLQQSERMDRIAQSMIIKGTLSLVAFVTLLLITSWFVYALWTVAALRIMVLIFFDLPNAARTSYAGGKDADSVRACRSSLLPCWDGAKLFALVRLAFPLGVVMLLLTLNSNIPRFFIERFLDPNSDRSNLGIFGAIGYLSIVGTLVIGAIGESSSARLARYYAQKRRDEFMGLLLRLIAMATALAVAGIGVAVLLGPWVLALLYGPAYADHAEILVWTMVAAGVAYVASILGYAMSAARYFRAQIPLFAIVVFVTILACWQLIPRLGLQGAALSLVVSSVIQFIGAAIIIGHAIYSLGNLKEIESASSNSHLQVQTP